MALLIQSQLVCSQVIPLHSLRVGMASGTEFRNLFKGRRANKAFCLRMSRVFIKGFRISSVTGVACHLLFRVDTFLKESDRLCIFSTEIPVAPDT